MTVTWQELSRRLKAVLDLMGAEYERGFLRCGDNPHYADTYRIKVTKVHLSLPCLHGDVYDVGVVVVHVTNNDYGVPVFRVFQVGELHIKGDFSVVCITRDGIRFSGLEGDVELKIG